MLMDVHQRGNLRFPQSLPEFQRLFPDDAACAGYLEKARWSDGFVCPHCQAAGEPFRFANRPGVLRCRRCRRDTPLSSASTGGSSTPSVPCSASRATSPHRPTQSFTPEPGSTLHVGGVGNNRIGKEDQYGVNLKDMDVNALLELRGEVDRRLTERKRDMQRQLGLLGKGTRQVGRPGARAGRGSALRGVKVLPKYRGPEGETWAGRGATPRWLTALLKQGHSIEDLRSRQGATKLPRWVYEGAGRPGNAKPIG